jgi:hypothetical protein
MDPWLESRWGGFHLLFISHIQNQINRQVRPLGLVARIDACIYPELLEPFNIRITEEQSSVGSVEVLDPACDDKIFTSLEVFSPRYKLDLRARRQYVRRREARHEGQTTTVEIDLLRDGESLAQVPMEWMPATARTPYGVWVRRSSARPPNSVEYYPIALRSRLPVLGVIPRRDDPNVLLDLQAAFDAAYEQGSFDLMDYDRDPNPPLPPEDLAWARAQIEQWRRRWA